MVGWPDCVCFQALIVFVFIFLHGWFDQASVFRLSRYMYLYLDGCLDQVSLFRLSLYDQIKHRFPHLYQPGGSQLTILEQIWTWYPYNFSDILINCDISCEIMKNNFQARARSWLLCPSSPWLLHGQRLFSSTLFTLLWVCGNTMFIAHSEIKN